MEHVNKNATTTNATHTAGATTRGRYVGPSAARIAELIAPRQRVRFERGWFWTAAFCHGAEHGQEHDLMAFRQRPDGDGIDVRCHRAAAQGMQSVNCSRERIIRSLEWLGGESIWSAYAAELRASTPHQSAADKADGTSGSDGSDGLGGRSWRLGLLPFVAVVAVLLPASFILGAEFEFAALSAVGYGWVGWLAHQALVSGRRAASSAKGGRPR